jgi:SRSO17 transposase
MQRLLWAASWDEDGLLTDVRDWTVKHPGDEQAIPVIDETGDVKKGLHTLGVQRQCTPSILATLVTSSLGLG